MENLFFILIQLTVASLVCCLADRVISGRPVFSDRSYCFDCGHPLSWMDLIPILSAPVLKFRCRHCGQPFTSPFEWFFFEAFFPIAMLAIPFTWSAGYFIHYLFFFLAREDSQEQRAHTDYLWPFIVYFLFSSDGLFSNDFEIILIKMLSLLILFPMIRLRKLGAGDFPFFILAALAFNESGYVHFLFISSFSTLVCGLLMVRNKKIPFLPFLLFSWIIVELI